VHDRPWGRIKNTHERTQTSRAGLLVLKVACGGEERDLADYGEFAHQGTQAKHAKTAEHILVRVYTSFNIQEMI
jgi:hypothetical protein